MNVVFYHRRPNDAANFSIERVFCDIRGALSAEVRPTVVHCRYPSLGFWKRAWNVVEAAYRQGEVNHVTGDIHYVALLLRRNRTILSVMDCVLLERERGLKWVIAYVLWYWFPARRSRLIIAISASTKHQLHKYLGCPDEQVRVIHCPVSASFRPAPARFNSDRPVILQFNTGPHKNVERVAEALVGIPCHLRIVGRLSAKQEDALQKYGSECSIVCDLSDEEVVEEYRRCDLVVLASTYEGFGLPIVEAQATGRPVVTSRLFSMPEVAGDAASLVDPFDVGSIRQGVLRIIQDADYRDELVEKGFRNVERFRPEWIAQQYLEVYREVCT